MELIKTRLGLFFCEGHLKDLPVSEQSLDPRYCQDCCRFLEFEATLLNPKRWGNPAWVPYKTLSNQNLGDKNPPSVGYSTPVDEKPKQLALFATTSHPPEPVPTSDKGLQPLSAVLPKNIIPSRNHDGNKSPGEHG